MGGVANGLECNLPEPEPESVLARSSVVHGNCRAGNFVFDEHSLEVTAVFDGERDCVGDRYRHAHRRHKRRPAG